MNPTFQPVPLTSKPVTPPWRHTHRDKVHGAPRHRDAGSQGLLVGIGALEGRQQGRVDVEHSPWKASTVRGNVRILFPDRALSCREQESGQDFSGRCFLRQRQSGGKGRIRLASGAAGPCPAWLRTRQGTHSDRGGTGTGQGALCGPWRTLGRHMKPLHSVHVGPVACPPARCWLSPVPRHLRPGLLMSYHVRSCCPLRETQTLWRDSAFAAHMCAQQDAGELWWERQ